MNEPFADVLKRLRKDAGLSFRALAAKVGCSRIYLVEDM